MSILNINANYNNFGNPSRLWTTGNQVETFVQGNYQIIKFYYNSGSADPTNGTGSFILPDNREVEYLIVGGGGTGGVARRASGLNAVQAQYAAGAAGGGAGVLATGSFYGLKNQRYNVVVGAGGLRPYGPQSGPSTGSAQNGAPSYVYGVTAKGSMVLLAPGGGAGGSVTVDVLDSTISGSNGGSGGGAGAEIITPDPNIELGVSGSGVAGSATFTTTFTSFQTNGGNAIDAGSGINNEGYLGGGGGSATAGGNGNLAAHKGGDGGSGSFNAISGSGQYFAGGGAGGYLTTSTSVGYFGLAGVGGGGGATDSTTGGTLGFALGLGKEQTGGGGAAAYSGGSGVVILKYNLYQTAL